MIGTEGNTKAVNEQQVVARYAEPSSAFYASVHLSISLYLYNPFDAVLFIPAYILN